MNEWISVKDALPPPDKESSYSKSVLIYYFKEFCIADLYWDKGMFNYDGNCDLKVDALKALNDGWCYWLGDEGPIDSLNVTHWMPLPEPPRENCKHVAWPIFHCQLSNKKLFLVDQSSGLTYKYCPYCGKTA